jgi:hypothetical protein
MSPEPSILCNRIGGVNSTGADNISGCLSNSLWQTLSYHLVVPLPDAAQDMIITNHDISSDKRSMSQGSSFFFCWQKLNLSFETGSRLSLLGTVTEEFLLEISSSIQYLPSGNTVRTLSSVHLLDYDSYDAIRKNALPALKTNLLSQFNQLLVCQASMGFLLYAVWHRLLLLNLIMWEWLEGVIKDAFQNPSHWLHRLWVCVQSLFDAQP